jgi:hypothetical protein
MVFLDAKRLVKVAPARYQTMPCPDKRLVKLPPCSIASLLGALTRAWPACFPRGAGRPLSHAMPWAPFLQPCHAPTNAIIRFTGRELGAGLQPGPCQLPRRAAARVPGAHTTAHHAGETAARSTPCPRCLGWGTPCTVPPLYARVPGAPPYDEQQGKRSVQGAPPAQQHALLPLRRSMQHADEPCSMAHDARETAARQGARVRRAVRVGVGRAASHVARQQILLLMGLDRVAGDAGAAAGAAGQQGGQGGQRAKGAAHHAGETAARRTRHAA